MFGDIFIKANDYNEKINDSNNNPFYYLTINNSDDSYDSYESYDSYDFEKDFEFTELFIEWI